ncbi:amino acid ABC transporter substrate-binding protein [Acidihalobacter yilgarnensis]|uniref:Amino acid ABC transporter substrate-binding protein n=1 Tax=Acidihalobacter yilgarnensis TaxID=2819280 RepID=A0A1D8IRT9_9GAMM|nr:ABC transporter substrate-binding protein [Acidihalobacter yilgarnensis]AOU99212.1 amino acid ABC transporter substrate-binding protein [Acidihalobacter yilgarnensis]
MFIHTSIKKTILTAACALGLAAGTAAAAEAPHEIKIGTLYAGSGPFASSSQPQYAGLEYWVKEMNAQGGVYVKAFHKRIPVKLIAYDDQSQTGLAGTLYNQLLTRDHVNLLVADFGSVLTSVAVPLARVHRTLLFDVTGTSAKFFTPGNPYIVLTSLPTSGVWPTTLAEDLIHNHPGRVAVLYSTNDFDQSQAETLKQKLDAAGQKPVFFRGVPSNTSSYGALLHSIAATKPDTVVEFGYPNNDIAFLQDIKAGGMHFNRVFTVFPGQLLSLMEKNVGVDGLAWTYTYPTPPLLRYNQVNYGPGIDAFSKAYGKATGHEVNFLTVAGYNAGLVIQKTLDEAQSLKQADLRKAVTGFSGKLDTLDGHFKINDMGAQIGETLPVGQLQPHGGKIEMKVVYPHAMATGKAVYPAPHG